MTCALLGWTFIVGGSEKFAILRCPPVRPSAGTTSVGEPVETEQRLSRASRMLSDAAVQAIDELSRLRRSPATELVKSRRRGDTKEEKCL